MKILSGTPRMVAAVMMIAILLVSQFAVAAYVCPKVAAAASSANSGHKDCPHQSVELPSLCEAHCEPDSQSAHTVQVPPVRPFIAAELSAVICDASAVVLFVRTRERGAPVLKRTTAPPLAIRNCCFRI